MRTSLNLQPVESIDKTDDGTIDVVDMPWMTMQGEGLFSGLPAVFVRLAGCNLKCPACDTDYTSLRKRTPIKDVVKKVNEVGRSGCDLVVITGGEPFRQAALSDLVRDLLSWGYKVQIETNGTLFLEDFPWYASNLFVVCSPKTPRIHSEMLERIYAYKYVLQHDAVDPVDGLPSRTLNSPVEKVAKPPAWFAFRDRVFVQPLDEGDEVLNELNQAAAVKTCLAFGWRFSVQLHKLLDLK